jgi:phosphoesterase RecJ-like protein
MNYIDLDKILAHIDEAESVFITAHISPDGDSIGSTFGLAGFINALGKKVNIVMEDDIPSYLRYIGENSNSGIDFISLGSQPDSKTLESITNLYSDNDLFIICDLNTEVRTGTVQHLINAFTGTKLVMDHHQNPKPFADGYYVDTDASSTSLLIFRLIQKYLESGNFINKDKLKGIATPLYTGIFTDSGGFSFQRTTKELLTAAAELIEWDADPVQIAKNINSSKTLSAFKLQSRAVNNIQFGDDNRVAVSVLAPKDFQETGALPEDKEGVVNKPLEIDTVQATALIYQPTEDNPVKVSFRSQGPEVNGIASKFGGGGHIYAAACRFSNLDIESVSQIIMKELKDTVENYINK